MSRDVKAPDCIPASTPTEAEMPEEPTAGVSATPGPSWRRRRWVVLLALLAGLGLLLAWSPWQHPADVRAGTTAVDESGMAARHGVEINLVAVTAAGGLIEVRLQITDPDKADAVLNDAGTRPILVSEDTGETLRMAAPPHHHGSLELGGQYFFLLANAHNALHAGSEVTVVIDDSRLEHIEVQG